MEISITRASKLHICSGQLIQLGYFTEEVLFVCLLDYYYWSCVHKIIWRVQRFLGEKSRLS